MHERLEHIKALFIEAKKELAICSLLVALTYITLFWPGSGPTVSFAYEPVGSCVNNTQNDLYMCSVNFSSSKWIGTYKQFACYLKIANQEYFLLEDTVSKYQKDFAFGMPREVKQAILPGKHKCSLVIKPISNPNTANKAQILSNELALEF